MSDKKAAWGLYTEHIFGTLSTVNFSANKKSLLQSHSKIIFLNKKEYPHRVP